MKVKNLIFNKLFLNLKLDQATTTRLYIGKLNSAVKKNDIASAFGVYGEINDLMLKDDFCFIALFI